MLAVLSLLLASRMTVGKTQICTVGNPCPPTVTAVVPVPLANSVPNFVPSDEWRQQASALLGSNVSYPAEAVEQHLEGVVRLAIKVRPDGGIISASIVQSSGSTILDNAAFQVVGITRTLPPLEPGAGPETEVILPLTYRLLDQ